MYNNIKKLHCVLFNFSPSLSISKEEIEKLTYIRPQTVYGYENLL